MNIGLRHLLDVFKTSRFWISCCLGCHQSWTNLIVNKM